MDPLAEKARRYATSAHARINQLRKYTLQPYDAHLKSVATMVADAKGDQAMVAAAWLHDIVEDTPTTFDDLEREFGAEITGLVKELTDVSRPRDGNRAARKAIDRAHLAGASPRGKTIKLADVIDNCRDICKHDPKFGRVYLEEMHLLLDVLREGDDKLHARARREVATCAKRLSIAFVNVGAASPEPPRESALREPAIRPRGIRLFTQAFTARDILAPLPSYDLESLGPKADRQRFRPGTSVFGVRRDGQVEGWATVEEMAAAGKVPKVRAFDPQQVVDLETPLSEVIDVLTHFTFCFVRFQEAIVGFIVRNDIERPVVRMWLFGIIILVEMMIVASIRSKWPGQDWTPLVGAARLQRAQELQAERRRRGVDSELLDCLQFSDKLQIAIQSPEFIESLGLPSMSAAKRVVKELEALRNDLAHGQDVTRHDWPSIVRLARRVQEGRAALG